MADQKRKLACWQRCPLPVGLAGGDEGVAMSPQSRRRVSLSSGGNEARSMSLVAIGARLRAICLALPDAHEEAMKRGPSYRVGDKIFALERPWDDWVGLWCKVPEGTRELILAANPSRFFVPAYFGAKGWIGVGLDEAADWPEVEAFVHRSYRLVAPKRLSQLISEA